MLLMASADPVHSGVVSDSIMVWVNHNDLVVFIGSVLTDPVGIQNSQVWHLSAASLLSQSSQVSGGLHLVDTLGFGFTVDDTLGDHGLSGTTSNGASIDNNTLFGFISESSGLIWSGWSGDSVHGWQLSVFPRPDSQDELHGLTLFLFPKFL